MLVHRIRKAGLALALTLLLLVVGCASADPWNESFYLGDNLYVAGKQMSPASYGELYETSENGASIDLTLADTFYQWTTSTAGDTAGDGYVVADVGADTLTIGPDGGGAYMVMVAFAFSGSVNTLIEGAVFLNGIRQQRLEFNRYLGAGGDQGFAGIMGIVSLAAGDTLDFRVKADGASKVVAVRHLSLAVNRIGR